MNVRVRQSYCPQCGLFHKNYGTPEHPFYEIDLSIVKYKFRKYFSQLEDWTEEVNFTTFCPRCNICYDTDIYCSECNRLNRQVYKVEIQDGKIVGDIPSTENPKSVSLLNGTICCCYCETINPEYSEECIQCRREIIDDSLTEITFEQPRFHEKEEEQDLFLETYQEEKNISSFICSDCNWFNPFWTNRKMPQGLNRWRVRCVFCEKERQGYWICPQCTIQNKVPPAHQECSPDSKKPYQCSICPYQTKFIHIFFLDGIQGLSRKEEEEWYQIFRSEKLKQFSKKIIIEKDRKLNEEIKKYQIEYKNYHQKRDQDLTDLIHETFQKLLSTENFTLLKELQNQLADEPNFLKSKLKENVLQNKKLKHSYFLDRLALWMLYHNLIIPECFTLSLREPIKYCPELISVCLFLLRRDTYPLLDPFQHVVEYLSPWNENSRQILYNWLQTLKYVLSDF
jgi:hypothetical protein